VATQGPASSALSAALVEVATILLCTAAAAGAVHWAAEQLGLADAARQRGERMEAAVRGALAHAAQAKSPGASGEDYDYDMLFEDKEELHSPQHPQHSPGDESAPEPHETVVKHNSEPHTLLHVYLTRPATTLVWATGVAASLRSVLRAAEVGWNAGVPLAVLGFPVSEILGIAWRLAIIACTAWGVSVWASEALERAAARRPRHAASYVAARALTRRLLAAAAVLATLSVMRVPLRAVLTFGGIGGVALGVGAQAASSNAIAGFALMLTHALHEGDKVELVGRGISGIVLDLSLTTVTILSNDATTVSLPNAELAKVPLRNFTRARTTAFLAAFPLPLHRLSEAPACAAAMERFLANHPAVAQTAAGGRLRSAVTVSGPGPAHEASAVTLQARAYIGTQGCSSEEIEQVNRELLVGLGNAIAAASAPLMAPAIPTLLRTPRPRRKLRRRERAEPERPAPLEHQGHDSGAVDTTQPPHGSDDFSWRGGEIEAEEDA